jgi:phosphoribosylamine---glycine ligase
MNILVIGSGGREHALLWKISQSKKCEKLFAAPGNAGTAGLAENIDISASDFKGLGRFVINNNITMVVVGPEAPLVEGIRDYFDADPSLKNVMVIGPGREGARLEGSKDYAKKFMSRHKIPTAGSRTFAAGQSAEAIAFIKSLSVPVVLKADGLAAGKGVIICNDHETAEKTIVQMLDEKMFGEASSQVVIEDYMEGVELSVFILTDGEHYLILPEAKDYKRIGKNDTGPNTGGMGAVSPVKFADKIFMKKVEDQIIIPTVRGLKKDNIDYRGFLFVGLMNVKGEPYVIEYNVRMGDPESQVVFPRLDSDLVDLLEAVAAKNLDKKEVHVSGHTAVTVVLAAAGYPGSYEKGKPISIGENTGKSVIFHAGTKFSDDSRVLTNGGRVMAVTGKGRDIQDARTSSYEAIKAISWDGMQFRDDIGLDLINLG